MIDAGPTGRRCARNCLSQQVYASPEVNLVGWRDLLQVLTTVTARRELAA
ncbi:hypothetical protein [Nonomuraea fuscirosea]